VPSFQAFLCSHKQQLLCSQLVFGGKIVVHREKRDEYGVYGIDLTQDDEEVQG
jgi:hypothetical protein